MLAKDTRKQSIFGRSEDHRKRCCLITAYIFCTVHNITVLLIVTFIRYDTRCYFNLRSKANMSQLNLPHGTDN